MMEHIVDLLKRHGIDEIVVTVAFLANAIRTYFGDGSEFGVQHGLRHRGDAARHGRLGAQRHGRARRALPRHLRRRAHRHRPRRHRRRSTRSNERHGHHRPRRTSRTRSSSASSSPSEDGSIERFLEKPTWGQVFSDTINTGIFVLEPEIFDYIEPDRPGRLLQRGVPRAARGRPAALRGGRRGLLGGRRHARGLRPGPQGHPRRQGRRSTSPASSSDPGVWLGEGAEVHPDAKIDGPGRHRRQLPGRGRRPLGDYTRARRQRPGPRRRRPRAHGRRTTTPTSASSVRLRGTVVGPVVRPAQRRAHRGGRGARRRVLRRRGRPARRRA